MSKYFKINIEMQKGIKKNVLKYVQTFLNNNINFTNYFHKSF